MASTYQTLSYGSTGDAVCRLQEALNAQGYSLDVDGVFGSKTKSAVRSYQKKNGLQLDGIVGEETWGSLLSAQSEAAESTPTATVSANTAKALEELEKGVTPSVETQTALAELRSIQDAQPEAYISSFQSQLNDLYDRITGAEAFSYDPQQDPAYRSYAGEYARAGKAAMTDTMGKAASLTGGYGSTYAQSAAQQAYESYLAKLSDVLPELQQNAYAIYQQKGESLLKQYELLKSRDDDAYDRWRDEVKDWQQQMEQAGTAYETAGAADLKNYQLLLNYYADKAQQERKLTASGVTVSGTAADSTGGAALSSVANESLKRAMTNYLKAGKAQQAQELLQTYESRMTPAQRRAYSTLFAGYGL